MRISRVSSGSWLWERKGESKRSGCRLLPRLCPGRDDSLLLGQILELPGGIVFSLHPTPPPKYTLKWSSLKPKRWPLETKVSFIFGFQWEGGWRDCVQRCFHNRYFPTSKASLWRTGVGPESVLSPKRGQTGQTQKVNVGLTVLVKMTWGIFANRSFNRSELHNVNFRERANWSLGGGDQMYTLWICKWGFYCLLFSALLRPLSGDCALFGASRGKRSIIKRRAWAENHTLRGDQRILGLFSLEKWQLGSGGLGRVDMVAPFK